MVGGSDPLYFHFTLTLTEPDTHEDLISSENECGIYFNCGVCSEVILLLCLSLCAVSIRSV